MAEKVQTSEPYPGESDPERDDALILNRDTFVPYLINQTSVLMNLPFKQDLKKNRMSYAHWTVLAILARCGPLSLNEISSEAVIDQPSLSRIIDQMVERKLVVRKPRKDDGRYLSISMTPFGRQRYSELSKVATAHSDALIEVLDEAELAQLRLSLGKVLRGLERRYRS